MANREVTVAPAGGDYSDLATAVSTEVGANADLTSDNGSGGAGILSFKIQGDWSGGADTGKVTVNGFTTSADYYIKIYTDSANRAVASSWDTDRYIIDGDEDHAFECWDNHVWIDGLQVTGGLYPVEVNNVAAGSWVRISNFRSNFNGSAIYVNDADATVYIWNSIQDGGGRLLLANNCSHVYVYNSIAYGSIGDGLEWNAGNGTVKNCAIFNNGDDIDFAGGGTLVCQYNAADDDLDTEFTEETNVQPANWANEFTNAAAGDFTLVDGGDCDDGGTDDPGSGLYSDDMAGDAWVSPWSIGVDELDSAGGSLVPILQMMRRRR